MATIIPAEPSREDSPWAHVNAPGHEIVRVTIWHLAIPHAVGLAVGAWLGAWSLVGALAAGSTTIALTVGLWLAWPRWSVRWFSLVLVLSLLPLDGAILALNGPVGDGFAIKIVIWSFIVVVVGLLRVRRLSLISLLRGQLQTRPLWPWEGWNVPDDLWRPRPVPSGLWSMARAAVKAC